MSKLVQSINKIEKQLQKSYVAINRIEVSRSAILHNFDLLESLNNGFNVIPVLKSNAYGHGLLQVTEILNARTFPYIAVDGYFEALKIRSVSKQPILIMGAIHPDNYRKIKIDDFAFVVGDVSVLRTLGDLNRKVKVHIDINTGMNRQGFEPSELAVVLRQLKKHKKLEVDGVMTHLADADNPKNDKYSLMQINKFDVAVEQILKANFVPKYIHLSNSSGSVKTQSRYANAIRPGFALYGLNALLQKDSSYKKYKKLKPAMEVKSKITKFVPVKKGDKVSYNGTFVAKKKMRLGVLPIGYHEGIPRILSNNGKFKCKEFWLNIIGRVCMNHIIVDASNQKIKLWDEVVIVSNKPKDPNSIKSLYREKNIFDYGFIAGLSQSIRRVIVE